MECPGCRKLGRIRHLTATDIVSETETEMKVHCFVCDYEETIKKDKAAAQKRNSL